jgi:putative transcriptional regulator
MSEKSQLSNNIRELRARYNLTQVDLASKVDVTRQTIISIEKNEYVPSLLLGMKIARVFHLNVERVFTQLK